MKPLLLTTSAVILGAQVALAADPAPPASDDTGPAFEMAQAAPDAAPPADDGTFTPLPDGIFPEMLPGADVFSVTSGEGVGEITEVTFTSAGAPKAAVVRVGGFLGFGTKRVAIDLADVDILIDEAERVRVEVTMTEDEMKRLPEYTSPSPEL